MKPKTVYLIAFLLGVICTIIGLVISSHYHALPPKPLLTNDRPSHPTNEPQRQPAPPVVEPAPPAQSVQTITAPVRPPETRPTKSANDTSANRPAFDPRLNDPVVKEELGRYALNFVGNDPIADEFWVAMIYDTSLSDKVREDLMEDLNENGFSGENGRVPTVQDLPLIASRIALIEDHMRDADDFMMEHLAEAHKDLVNMWFELTRQ